jgi:hypothetical protein
VTISPIPVVSPGYLADALRRIEARHTARAEPRRAALRRRRAARIVGYFGTVEIVDQVDRRPRGVDPAAVDVAVASAVDELVDEFLRPYVTAEVATIGNEELLRGIPVEGFGGTIRGTGPVHAALKAERDADRARREQ